MSYFSEDRMAEMRQFFFETAQELLQALNEEALQLERTPTDAEIVSSIRRTVHTLKGDSAACGFRELSEIAHTLEDALAPEIASTAPAEVAQLVLSAADVFDAMLAGYRGNLQLPATEPLRLMINRLRLTPVQADAALNSPVLPASWNERQQLAIDQALEGGEKLFKITADIDPHCAMKTAARQLVRSALEQSGKILASHPPEGVSDATRLEFIASSKQVGEQIANKCRIPSVTSRVTVVPYVNTEEPAEGVTEDETGANVGSYGRAGRQLSALIGKPENTLRVDAERIDEILNLIGELIIGKSMLQQAVNEFTARFAKDPLRNHFADAMAFQNRILHDLQRSAMQVRMVPVEQLFRRFPRLVRDLSRQCGKQVVLEMRGQDTEVDKSILDALAEPLAHLVRNAVDHGIESAEQRQKANKPFSGTVRLDAYHQGNQVVIEVKDDGRGIDPQLITRLGIERGIVAAEEAARLNEAEIIDLIFRPGFTTSGHLTEISGRGIGMDVVRSVLQRLKGAVTVQSQVGTGTTVQLRVPLTLAIIKALLFRVDQRLYAIPLSSVVEITRVRESEINTVGSHEVTQLRDAVLTVVRLGSRNEPDETTPKRMFMVVIRLGERKFGLIVDNLMGEEELVIKPLDNQVVATELVSGASMLGDGTVVLILNLSAVVERYAKARTAQPGGRLAGVLARQPRPAELEIGAPR
jgi:two-component system chemotaxis sensor kinase CheA